jgi:hypothetical protein
MAANNVSTSINLVDLDQGALLNDFRNYLRTQDIFKDYDFKGSDINILLDVMSYNTFKNAFFLNMAFSERWLDSAQLRSSIFSHAKELNYLPRSMRSAKASVTINFTATGDQAPYIIPKGAQLSTIVKSTALTFSTPETIVVSSVDQNYTFTTDIYEGVYVRDPYVYTQTDQRFKITNPNIDTTSLTVTVFEDGSTVGDVYKQAMTLLDLDEFSKVFFVQTSETGSYEVIFGDNILGRRPKFGAAIAFDYRISKGSEGNGAKQFSVDFDPTGVAELTGSPTIEVIEASNNGTDAETNESIKYYAPRSYQVQERTVTATDYEVALKQQFPEINAVAVYGGEELDPPIFGKVFIAIDIKDVDGLPDSKRDQYFSFLKSRAPFSIDPQFIDADFMYLAIDTLIRYNINVTTNSANRMKAIVADTINSFNKVNLNDFNVIFRNSIFSKAIDNADTSIISNITNVAVYKKVNPSLTKSNNFDINFGIAIESDIPAKNKIYPAIDDKAVWSSSFTFQNQTCTIEDDGNGVLNIVKPQQGNKIVVVSVGTVDYKNGFVSLKDFSLTNYDGSALKIYVSPADKDILASKNNVMLIDPTDVTIAVETLRI